VHIYITQSLRVSVARQLPRQFPIAATHIARAHTTCSAPLPQGFHPSSLCMC
jgi:hypothetical protein